MIAQNSEIYWSVYENNVYFLKYFVNQKEIF